MKKLAILLQIIGLLAVCPIYVFLEIRHSGFVKSEVRSESSRSKTEIMSARESKVQADNTYNITSHPNTK